MKKTLSLTAGLLLTTTAVSAAGIDRNLTNYGILFEQGNYAELSYATVSPDVSGEYSTALTQAGGARNTGVMSEDFDTLSGSLKYELTPRLDLGLFFNQPFGANASYPDGAYTGLAAEWDSNGQSIVLKYKVTPAISVYGGVRSIESQANILIPNQLIGAQAAPTIAGAQADGAAQLAAAARQAATAAAAASDAATAAQLGAQAQDLADQAQALGAAAAATVNAAQNGDPRTGPFAYTATTESDRQTSYIVGAAYERPEIALRVAFTYESGYTHSFGTVENIDAIPLVSGQSTTEISMPDVYTLDFQSGVAKDTLVFGSIRHATWSDWHVRPQGYAALTGDEVTGIDSDSTTYRIGVGRKINDSFSGFARVTYEASNGDELSRLAPTDGSTAFGFGGTYSRDAIKVTAGIEYIKFGDGEDASNTSFADNDAVAVGLSVGYRF